MHEGFWKKEELIAELNRFIGEGGRKIYNIAISSKAVVKVGKVPFCISNGLLAFLGIEIEPNLLIR